MKKREKIKIKISSNNIRGALFTGQSNGIWVRSFVKRQGPAITFHLMVPLHYTRHCRCPSLVFPPPPFLPPSFKYCKSIEKSILRMDWPTLRQREPHGIPMEVEKHNMYINCWKRKESQRRMEWERKKGPCTLNNNALSLCVCRVFLLLLAATALPLSYWAERVRDILSYSSFLSPPRRSIITHGSSVIATSNRLFFLFSKRIRDKTYTYSQTNAAYSRGHLCNKLSSRSGRPDPQGLKDLHSLNPKKKSIICWDEMAEFFLFYLRSLPPRFSLIRLRGNCQCTSARKMTFSPGRNMTFPH